MPALPKCSYCPESASRLHYYTKQYPSGKSTIESPIISCEACVPKALADLNIVRGGIESVQTITFLDLGKKREKEIGWLTSKRGYERNELATKAYRQLLYSIHYLSRPSKKQTLIDSLEWYRHGLLKDVDNGETDRQVSGMLDCVDTILRELNDKP